MNDGHTQHLEIAQAWRARADDLSQWAFVRLVARTDAWGGYLPLRVRKPGGSASVTKPSKAKRGKVFLTPDTLRRHFAGRDQGDIAGLYPCNDKGECRWFLVDVDKHPGDTADPVKNFAAALHWHDELTSMGFDPLLTDSNGKGGYHILVVLDTPLALARVHDFAHSLVADYATHGLAAAPEVFPKQREISEGEFGNWARLPGRHHTEHHWSKVFDPKARTLVEGAAAIALILRHWGDPADLVPEVAPQPKPAPAAPPPRRRREPRPGQRTDADVARECLDHISPIDNYDEWLNIGMALHHAGADVADWDAWSRRNPVKYREGECEKKWPTFSASRGNSVTIATLITLARQNGYEPYPKGQNGQRRQSQAAGEAKPAEARAAADVPPGVPIMITRDQRQQLHDLGYTRGDVDAMTPEEANSILCGGVKKATEPPAEPEPTAEGEGEADAARAFDGAAPDPADEGGEAFEQVEQSRIRVQEALKNAIESKSVGPIFKVAEDLALLPVDEREEAINAARDALGRKLSIRSLRSEIKQATPRPERNVLPDDKPKISVGGEWSDRVRATARILSRTNNPPTRFERMAVPTRIVEDEKGRKIIVPITETYLRGEMGREITYYAVSEKTGEVFMPPPSDIAKDLAERINDTLIQMGDKPFPPLAGLVETPVLRPDGTIITKPGYDAQTGLFYWPALGLDLPPIPSRPTARDVAVAIELLNEMLGDFPYESDVDRVNVYGTMITPTVRHLVQLVPIAVIDAPQAGTGKSLLAGVIHAIATGTPGNMLSIPAADEEMRKLITSSLMEGAGMMLFDNLDGQLFHPSLARAVTATVWKDRRLGVNENVAVPQLATWIVTGNNVALAGDLPRRCYRCRLDAKTSKPWDDGRTYAHPNLIPWVLENRGRIIAAILTLCRAWFAAGKPEYNVPQLGSFEAWSSTVGNVLAHVGIQGFLANRDEMYAQADEDSPQWEAFLTAWNAKYGDRLVSAAAIVEEITLAASLRDALPDSLSGFVEQVTSLMAAEFRIKESGRFKIRLGRALSARKGRRYGPAGLYLVRGEDSHSKIALWSVKSASNAGSAGNGGSVSAPMHSGNSNGAHVNGAPHVHTDTGMGRTTPATPCTPRNDDYEEEERLAIQEADGS